MRSKIFGLIILVLLSSGCAITQEVGTNGTTRTRVEVLPSVNVQYGVTRSGYYSGPGINNLDRTGVTNPYNQRRGGVYYSQEHLMNGNTGVIPNPHYLSPMPRFINR